VMLNCKPGASHPVPNDEPRPLRAVTDGPQVSQHGSDDEFAGNCAPPKADGVDAAAVALQRDRSAAIASHCEGALPNPQPRPGGRAPSQAAAAGEMAIKGVAACASSTTRRVLAPRIDVAPVAQVQRPRHDAAGAEHILVPCDDGDPENQAPRLRHDSVVAPAHRPGGRAPRGLGGSGAKGRRRCWRSGAPRRISNRSLVLGHMAASSARWIHNPVAVPTPPGGVGAGAACAVRHWLLTNSRSSSSERGGRDLPSGANGGGGAANPPTGARGGGDADPKDRDPPPGARMRSRIMAAGSAAAAPNEGNQETSTTKEDAANPVRRDRA
jgi:hypothetical protein